MTDLQKCYNKIAMYKNPIIGVTGSCGKTTTCKMIYELLKNKYTVDKTHENSNSLKGIPWCVNSFFNITSDVWLIEMGIARRNNMTKLINMVKPRIRIITNIKDAHLGNFNNLSEYQNEKLKFLNNINQNNIIIINNDDKILNSYIFNSNIKVIRCGSNNSDDIQLISFKLNSDNITSTIHIRINKNINKDIKFVLNGICEHNAMNSCLAIGCAMYFNIPIDLITNTLNNFTLYKNRGLIILRPKYIIYDYTYNFAISACMKNLENFNKIDNKNKLIIIGFTVKSTHFKNYETSILPILDYCNTITKNIIIYPIDKKLMNINKYNNVLFFSTFNDIITNINKLSNSTKLSIFIQAEHYLYLYENVNKL